MKVDLTVLAIPAYVGAMGAEWLWQRRHPVPAGTRAGDYQLADTLASLSMGFGSLAAPYLTDRLLAPVTPGRGRWAKALIGLGAAAAVATTTLDVVRRARSGALPEPGVVPDDVREVQDELAERRYAEPGSPAPEMTPSRRPAPRSLLERVHGGLAVSAITSAALTVATTWGSRTTAERLFARSGRDLGGGPLALATAILGWDFIYYWNHRSMHESRWLWAMHVAHHSSEHYNLSTALRQPVADGVILSIPYGLLALLGVRPSLLEHARGVNLIYQFWIHTEAIDKVGRWERWLNTPSHHRVHHGSNHEYLDRNHGSILILWDRLFGTFEEEDERVVYGLTRNIDTYNPARIATHEWVDIGRDIAAAETWHDRVSYLLRGPGWAYQRRESVARVG